MLSGLRRSLTSGTYVPVLLTFQNAGTIRLDLPVLAQADSYATFSPAPTPTPSASAKGKRRHHGQGGHAHPDRRRNRHGHPDRDPHGLTQT